jgi:cell division protein FtsQ
MWHNPRLLNTAASVLIALAACLTLFAAAHLAIHSPEFSLRNIRVSGDLEHVGRGQIVSVLQGRLRGTFFTVDIDEVRALFETIPWVRHAQVRRRWPDRLEVRLEEHTALARWGSERHGRLVNTYGELFAGHAERPLPAFSGPAGSELEVTRRYAQFRRLLEPLALAPESVELSERHAWQIRLSNGLTVELGRDSEKDRAADRLARFVAAYPDTLARIERRFYHVDLRYPNGFALRVPEARGPAERKKAGAA